MVGVAELGEHDGDLVMWKLYVLPSSQHHGVGVLLLEAIKHVAAQRRLPLVTECVTENTRAGQFYRSQGFVDVAAPTGALDTVWMRYEQPQREDRG